MRLRYLAIDCETTGLDPGWCHLLEVGCVADVDGTTPVEDLPTLRLLVEPPFGQVRGEAVGMVMNVGLLEEISRASPGQLTPAAHVAALVRGFALTHLPPTGRGRVTLAGKNLGRFDLRFLRRLPGWAEEWHDPRLLDPAVLFWDPAADERLPGLPACLDRAGVAAGPAHRAVEDARAVVRLVRAGAERLGALAELERRAAG